MCVASRKACTVSWRSEPLHKAGPVALGVSTISARIKTVAERAREHLPLNAPAQVARLSEALHKADRMLDDASRENAQLRDAALLRDVGGGGGGEDGGESEPEEVADEAGLAGLSPELLQKAIMFAAVCAAAMACVCFWVVCKSSRGAAPAAAAAETGGAYEKYVCAPADHTAAATRRQQSKQILYNNTPTCRHTNATAHHRPPSPPAATTAMFIQSADHGRGRRGSGAVGGLGRGRR